MCAAAIKRGKTAEINDVHRTQPEISDDWISNMSHRQRRRVRVIGLAIIYYVCIQNTGKKDF